MQTNTTWEDEVLATLTEYDFAKVNAKCTAKAEELLRGKSHLGDPAKVLRKLRQYRCFSALEVLGNALLETGIDNIGVRQPYVQALIDQGQLYLAEGQLHDILRLPNLTEFEDSEARGLLGRIYKQRYVNRADIPARDRALGHYLDAAKPCNDLWPFINAIAISARASLRGEPPVPASLLSRVPSATAVRDRLVAAEPHALQAWDIATLLEAHVALDDYDAAWGCLGDYCKKANAFELASTYRQLDEVWELSVRAKQVGDEILCALLAARAQALGASVDLVNALGKGVAKLVATLEEDASSMPAGTRKQAFLSTNQATQGLRWLKLAVSRAPSVARIESRSGRAIGTGFVAQIPALSEAPVLVTNAHVLRETSGTIGIDRASAVAVFTGHSRATTEISAILRRWESLDITIASMATPPTALALPSGPVEPPAPGHRLYIVGHPGGRDIEYSLYDNRMIKSDSMHLYYRSPTEHGSSGSPVFDEEWRLVGVHHSTQTTEPVANFGTRWSCVMAAVGGP